MGSPDIVDPERGSVATDHPESFEKPMTQHIGKTEAERALNLHLEHGNFTWTPEEERRLLWKLDLLIIPLAFLSNLLTQADSGAYGVAAIFHMVQDLDLFEITNFDPIEVSTTKYSWTSSIPVFGLIVAIFPVMLLVQRMAIGKLFGLLVAWSGVFAFLMLVVKDFASTMVVRFFYGFQGACISILIVYISFWYTQSEQSSRLGITGCGAAAGALVGQAIDLGAVSLGGRFADEPWRWMYLILGALSIVIAILDVLILPTSPSTARFLTEREKMIAIERIRSNGTGMQSAKFEISSLLSCLKDPQIWGLAYITFVIAFGNAAVGSFGGLLAGSFGFTPVRTLQLLMPASGVAVVVFFVAGIIPAYVKNSRIYVSIVGFLITIAGNVLLWRSPRNDTAALLGGLYISVFFFGAYVHLQSMVASNIGGSTKKTVSTTIIFILASIGGIVAPFAYKGQESAQGYPTGIITTLVLQVIAVIDLILLRIYYSRYNKKADAAMVAQGYANVTEQELGCSDIGFADVGEKQVPYFRYQF